jgi:hypothetical protein
MNGGMEEKLTQKGLYGKTYLFSNPYTSYEETVRYAKTAASNVMEDFSEPNLRGSYWNTLELAMINLKDTIRHALSKEKFTRDLDYASQKSNHIFLVPGLLQNSGAFATLCSLLENEGFGAIPIKYDYRMPINESADYIAEKINYASIQLNRNGIALGHSTGADNLRYIAAKDLAKLSAYIFSAPITNGDIPNLISKIFVGNLSLFGNFINYCDPRNQEGRQNIAVFNQPISVPHMTISALRDWIVPLEASIDTNGYNLIVDGFGHLDGTGVNKKFNQVYLETIEFFFEQLSG